MLQDLDSDYHIKSWEIFTQQVNIHYSLFGVNFLYCKAGSIFSTEAIKMTYVSTTTCIHMGLKIDKGERGHV